MAAYFQLLDKTTGKAEPFAKSGHTGVFNQATGKYVVCKVCGDSGVLDALSIEYYGQRML